MHIDSEQPFAILIMIELRKIKWPTLQVVWTGQAFRHQGLHLTIISNSELRDRGLRLKVVNLHEWFSDSISMKRHTEGIMHLLQPAPCIKQRIFLQRWLERYQLHQIISQGCLLIHSTVDIDIL